MSSTPTPSTSTSPAPSEILELATHIGYRPYRPVVSRTLFLVQIHTLKDEKPVKIHIYYTTRSIMTLLEHPTKGVNRLWRSNAYVSLKDLEELLEDPRKHTSKGYRQADNAVRVCARCQQLKSRQDFSNNQWKVVGPDKNACKDCITGSKKNQEGHTAGTAAGIDDNGSVSTNGQIDNLVELTQGILRIHDESSDIDNLVELTEDMLKIHEEKERRKSGKSKNVNKIREKTIQDRKVRKQFNCPDCPKHGRGPFIFFKKVPAMKPVCKCPRCKLITRGRCKRLYPVKTAKGYGLFQCHECRDKWGSSRAIENVAQECFTCREQGRTNMVKPFRLEVYKKQQKKKGRTTPGAFRPRRPRRVPVDTISEVAATEPDYTPSDRARNATGGSNALFAHGRDQMYHEQSSSDTDSSFVHVGADDESSSSQSSTSTLSSYEVVGSKSSQTRGVPSGYEHRCAACATGACRSRRIALSEVHDISDGNTVSTSASVVTNSSVDKREYFDRDENFDGFEDNWHPEE